MTGTTAAAGDGRLAPMWRAVHRWAVVPYVLAGIAAIVVVAVLGHEVRTHLHALEDWIRRLGVLGPIAFVAIFVVGTSLFVPDSLISIAAGVAFGLWTGFLAVVAGGVAACVLQYGLARYLLGAPIERMLARRPKLHRLLDAIRRDQLRLEFILRLTPVSPTLVSYALGAGRVRFLPFVAALSGHVPAFFLEVYVGAAGKHAMLLPWRSGSTPITKDALIFGGLAVCAAVMLLIAGAARRALNEAESSAAA